MLEDKRMVWAQSLLDQQDDFKAWMPGGPFMWKRHGEVAQVLQASPRRKSSLAWAQKYHMSMLASFTLSKYTDKVASALALYWCAKCQFLFDIWCNQADPEYEYIEDDVTLANDPTEFEAAWEGLPKEHAAWERVDQIVSSFPRLD